MKRIVVVMTAMGAFATPAFALTETFSHQTTTQSMPFVDNFTLPAFDPSLGTLNSILLTLSTNSTAEVDVTNSGSTSQNFKSATSSVPITLDGPAGVSTPQTVKAGPFSGSVSANSTTVITGPTVPTSTNVSVPTANFASYEGASSNPNLTFDVTGDNGIYSGSAGAGVSFGGKASAGGTSQITYTYTVATPPTPSVPEPAAFTILGLGIAGLSIVRRRHG